VDFGGYLIKLWGNWQFLIFPHGGGVGLHRNVRIYQT